MFYIHKIIVQCKKSNKYLCEFVLTQSLLCMHIYIYIYIWFKILTKRWSFVLMYDAINITRRINLRLDIIYHPIYKLNTFNLLEKVKYNFKILKYGFVLYINFVLVILF